ncbi:uncharacterized protein F4822DRAFT_101683 [Hypoxylon trugodes]|uniref:uncharacterized protein n=1 Tax=Hypoxylon trugodes TaxID=326681 RepID=UPI0021984374|nr:uncharacterized protein F4822DRAFT_101683 [Hypoxylon trugodes]KAI1382650.1 hypothetical protein F4822DRAFT_101683 [Hypoxylon trugodes]
MGRCELLLLMHISKLVNAMSPYGSDGILVSLKGLKGSIDRYKRSINNTTSCQLRNIFRVVFTCSSLDYLGMNKRNYDEGSSNCSICVLTFYHVVRQATNRQPA